jgi:hypothetical protein
MPLISSASEGVGKSVDYHDPYRASVYVVIP